MTEAHKIPGTEEAWDSGDLGTNRQSMRITSPERTRDIDEALGLQSISIRLPKALIGNFKSIAKIHGMGYQPLMREALARFAEHEMKVLINEYANRLAQDRGEVELPVPASEDAPAKEKAREAA